jgi:hypothetical protein
MCPFWKRISPNLNLEQEKRILKQVYDSGVLGIAFTFFGKTLNASEFDFKSKKNGALGLRWIKSKLYQHELMFF